MGSKADAWIVLDRDTDTDYEYDADGVPFTKAGAEALAATLNASRQDVERTDRVSLALPAERPMREVTAPTRGSGPVKCDDPTCIGHRERCRFGLAHSWSTWFDNGRLMRTSLTYHCHVCGGVCTAEEIDTRPQAGR